MLAFGDRRRPRRLGLTPMIDVVFLLLIFFMLAARFGTDAVLPLRLAGSDAADTARDEGAVRVVDVLPEALRLNGEGIAEADLVERLAPLMRRHEDVIVVRARDGAVLQRVVDTLHRLKAAGYGTLVFVE